jgi:hypothetical protein
MAGKLNALEPSLRSLPQLRVELNSMRTTGNDHLGRPADPELIQSIEDLLTAVSRISAIFRAPAGCSGTEIFDYHKG